MDYTAEVIKVLCLSPQASVLYHRKKLAHQIVCKSLIIINNSSSQNKGNHYHGGGLKM